jgi:hypothetical protein
MTNQHNQPQRVSESCTFKRTKMMKTVTGRITVRFAGFLDAFGNHLFGCIIKIGSFFFLLFALHTNGQVIING